MRPEDVENLLGRFEPPPIPAELDRRILEKAREAPAAPGKEDPSRLTRTRGRAAMAASFFFLALALWAILRSPRPPEVQGDPSLWEARRARLVEQGIPIKPTAAELAWQQIPWMTDLAEALRAAGREKRPLFVWVSFMDPLDRACGTAAGFRGGPLSDEEVIWRISSSLVPVALDHRRLNVGDDPAGRLVRTLKGDPESCIGAWIVSPEGKVLARPLEGKDRAGRTREVLSAIDRGLQPFAPLTLREARPVDPRPYRGKSVQADGSVSLALSMRLLRRQGTADGPMVIDSVAVPAGEWASLVPPPRAGVGVEWALPESLARRFAAALVPNTDGVWIPRPEEVRIAAMKATVEAVTGDRVLLRLEGRWESERAGERSSRPYRASATAEGTAEVDLETRTLRSVSMVFSGLFDELYPGVKPRSTGAVVEWKR